MGLDAEIHIVRAVEGIGAGHLKGLAPPVEPISLRRSFTQIGKLLGDAAKGKAILDHARNSNLTERDCGNLCRAIEKLSKYDLPSALKYLGQVFESRSPEPVWGASTFGHLDKVLSRVKFEIGGASDKEVRESLQRLRDPAFTTIPQNLRKKCRELLEGPVIGCRAKEFVMWATAVGEQIYRGDAPIIRFLGTEYQVIRSPGRGLPLLQSVEDTRTGSLISLFLFPHERHLKPCAVAGAKATINGPSQDLPGCVGILVAVKDQIANSDSFEIKILELQSGLKSDDSVIGVKHVVNKYRMWRHQILQHLCEYARSQNCGTIRLTSNAVERLSARRRDDMSSEVENVTTDNGLKFGKDFA